MQQQIDHDTSTTASQLPELSPNETSYITIVNDEIRDYDPPSSADDIESSSSSISIMDLFDFPCSAAHHYNPVSTDECSS